MKNNSKIKEIFSKLVEGKNQEANKEIKSKKFGVIKITRENIEQLATFDLDEAKEEALKP